MESDSSTISPECPKRTAGRPPIYTPELGQQISDYIADDHTLREIEEFPGMPSRQTIRRWMWENEDFISRYDRARQRQAHTIDEKQLEIVEELKKKKMTSDAARVILQTYQWRASKKNPKAYGDATTIRGDAENPLKIGLSARLDDALKK